MSRGLIITIIIIIGAISGAYYLKHVIGKRQAVIINSIIENDLQDDIAFVGSIIPILCENKKQVSYLVTAILTNSEEPDSARLNNELLRISRELPSRINRAMYFNDWQKTFIRTISPCLNNLQNLPANSDINSSQCQSIFQETAQCIKENLENNDQFKIEIVAHFSNRILKNVSLNYHSFIDKIAISLLSSGTIFIQCREALEVYENLKKALLKNPEFETAYKGGCLTQLDEITESLIMAYCLQNRGLSY